MASVKSAGRGNGFEDVGVDHDGITGGLPFVALCDCSSPPTLGSYGGHHFSPGRSGVQAKNGGASCKKLELFLTKIRPCNTCEGWESNHIGVSPTLSPQGDRYAFAISVVSQWFCRCYSDCSYPRIRSVFARMGLRAARGLSAMLAQNLPRRSRDPLVHTRTGCRQS
jgi:hypothetical protein